MNFRDQNNPYAPPVDTLNEPVRFGQDDMQISAERGTRFLARLIDGLISMAVVIPVILITMSLKYITMRDMQNSLLIGGVAFAAALPVSIVQWSMIARSGQSIGKRVMKIRIVRMDGSPVGFGNGVVLRDWITQAISMVPYLGGIINLIGILMIFGEERRCLHDRIAGTKVIAVL